MHAESREVVKGKAKVARLIAKGDYEGAAGILGELVKNHSKNDRLVLKYAEVLAKIGQVNNAVAHYKRLADRYADDGFLIRAISVNKMILDLAPDDREIHNKLAVLYSKRGLPPSSSGVVSDAEPRESSSAARVGAALAGAKRRNEERQGQPPPTQPAHAPQPAVKPRVRAPSLEMPAAPTPVVRRDLAKRRGSLRDRAEVKEAAVFGITELGAGFGSPQPGYTPSPGERLAMGEPMDLDWGPEGEQDEGIEVNFDEPMSMFSPVGEDGPPAPPLSSEEIPAASAHRRAESPFLAGAFDDEAPASGAANVHVDDNPSTLQLEMDAVLSEEPDPEAEFFQEEDALEVGEPVAAFSGDFEVPLTEPVVHVVDDLEEVALAEVDLNVVTVPKFAPKLPQAVYTPLFSDLSPAELGRVMEKVRPARFEAGATVCSQGESDDSLYIVATGSVKVASADDSGEPQWITNLGDGDFFGEFAFFGNTARAASVVALEETELLEIRREDLKAIGREYPRVLSVLVEFYKRRVLDLLLARNAVFRNLEAGLRAKLVDRARLLAYPKGRLIIREGKKGAHFFVVKSGDVQVSTELGDDLVVLADLKPGDFFGEISLLTETTTTANVRAVTDTVVACFQGSDIAAMADMYPPVYNALKSLSLERTRESIDKLSKEGLI